MRACTTFPQLGALTVDSTWSNGCGCGPRIALGDGIEKTPSAAGDSALAQWATRQGAEVQV